MKLAMLVNDPRAIQDRQTTDLIAARAVDRDHEVWAVGVTDLWLAADDTVWAHAWPVRPGTGPVAARLGDRERLELSALDLLLLRTNPGRDDRPWAHDAALELARVVKAHGVVVLNDPDGLARARSKLYQAHLSADCRPTTVVSADRAVLRAFVEEAGRPCVLKPLDGTRGRDVFFVSAGDRNLPQILDVLTRAGFAMAQHQVPEAAEGDVRLVLLDGALLEVDSKVAAVRRVPGKGDLRSNVFVGGHAARVDDITPRMREVCAALGPKLRADGIHLAGLDLIGPVIVEVNVYSPGGLWDAEQYYGADFIGAIVASLEGHARAAR